MAVYVEETGDKNAETIVFIHGGGVAGWMWKMQRQAFGDYHLLIPDLPDHGRSASEGHITIEDAAERVASLIRKRAKDGKAHVVGHSLGGKIAVQLLADHPEAIDRAVVASALFRPYPLIGWTANMTACRLSVWMLKNKAVLRMQADQFKFPDDGYRGNFMADTAMQTPESLHRILAEMNNHSKLPAGLERAQVPTLVVAGEREPKAMRLSVADVARALPQAKSCLVKGGRHTFPWEKSDAFNDVIRSWLTGREIDNPEIIPAK